MALKLSGFNPLFYLYTQKYSAKVQKLLKAPHWVIMFAFQVFEY